MKLLVAYTVRNYEGDGDLIDTCIITEDDLELDKHDSIYEAVVDWNKRDDTWHFTSKLIAITNLSEYEK